MNLAQQLERSKSRHEKAKKVEQTWAGPSWVTMLTGWKKEKLRQAREQGLIKYREDGKSYKYLLESIPAIFIKQQQTA